MRSLKPRDLFLLELSLAVAAAVAVAVLATCHADLRRVLSAWPWTG
jgi:hypothetical protein